MRQGYLNFKKKHHSSSSGSGFDNPVLKLKDFLFNILYLNFPITGTTRWSAASRRKVKYNFIKAYPLPLDLSSFQKREMSTF
jgi:hypothetical protein